MKIIDPQRAWGQSAFAASLACLVFGIHFATTADSEGATDAARFVLGAALIAGSPLPIALFLKRG